MSEKDKVGYVWFGAEINLNTAEQLISACLHLIQKNGVNHLYFLFASPGGLVAQGVELYNKIKALPAQVTMHNTGNVDSMGNAVFLSGDRRLGCPTSTFMFHGVSFPPSGKNLEGKDLRELLNGLKADESKISTIIADETSLTLTEAYDLFVESSTIDANAALEQGIIHDICMPEIDAAAPYISLAFNR